MRNFEKFLIKLRESGATLAFFCDGQLQSDKNDEWCRRRDGEFQVSLNMISEHTNQDVEFKRRFGCKTIVKSLLKLVKDKHYGDVVISTQVDCDVAIAKVNNIFQSSTIPIFYVDVKYAFSISSMLSPMMHWQFWLLIPTFLYLMEIFNGGMQTPLTCTE